MWDIIVNGGAVVGMAALSFLGINIVRGGKPVAIFGAVVVGLVLTVINAKFEGETGRGIVTTFYCQLLPCRSEGTQPANLSAPVANVAVPVAPAAIDLAPVMPPSPAQAALSIRYGHWEGERDWGRTDPSAPNRHYNMNFAPGTAQDNDGDCASSVVVTPDGGVTIRFPGGTTMVGRLADGGQRIEGERIDSAGKLTGRFHMSYSDANSALQHCPPVPGS